MSAQNDQYEVFSFDRFEEFEMEMVDPRESEIPIAPAPPHPIQNALDELLCDGEFWQSSPTTFDAFARLNEKLNAQRSIIGLRNGSQPAP